MGEGKGEGLGYRRDVDGVRAVAILVVVAFHVGLPGFGGGFVGVDVFFVISGFLITALLAREAQARDGIRLSEFYARRVRRLLPALATVIVATLALGGLLLPPLGEQQALARSALLTAAFLSNVHFWRASGDYFALQGEEMPLLHTWSLAVEEQYYLAWPLLLLFASSLARRRNRPFQPLALRILAGVFALSFAACVWTTAREPAQAFYLTPFRAWEFALGGLLALRGGAAPSPRRGAALVAAGLAAIAAASAGFGPGTAFPGAWALVPVLGATAVIAGGSVGSPLRSLLASPLLVRIGQLSYSWYLWHWPLLAFARAGALGERSLPRDAALAALALVLAELTYRFVENPIRIGRPGPFRATSPTLASGLALSLLVAGAAWLLEHRAAGPARRAEARLGAAITPLNPACNGFVERPKCTSEGWGRRPGIVVWGDSHAAPLASLAEAFRGAAGVPFLQRTALACPPLRNVLPTVEGREAYEDCGDFNRAVEGEIEELVRAGQLRGVLLAGRWPNYLAPGDARAGQPRRLVVGGRVMDRGGSVRALRQGLKQRIQWLRGLGLRVLVVAPVPEFPWRVPQCVLARGAAACRIPRARAEDERRLAMGPLRDATRDQPDVRLFDGLDTLCPGEWCEPTVDGVVAFADEHHLTAPAAASLLPAARADLDWLAAGG